MRPDRGLKKTTLDPEKEKFNWIPSNERIAESNLARLMGNLGIESLDELWKFSVSEMPVFWDEVAKDLDIRWFSKYATVLDDSMGVQWPRWFVGGRLNIAYNCLDKHIINEPYRTALIYESERRGKSRRLSYEELFTLTNKIANALTGELDIKRGDKVGIFMPMVPEAVAAYLAAIRAGAIAVPVFSGYGSEAISSRLGDCEAVALITSETFTRRDKQIAMKQIALESARRIPTLKSVLVFNDGESSDFEQPSEGAPKIFNWNVVNKQSEVFEPEVMESEDPFMIIYTSGTTGKPKGAVHVHGGFMVKIAEEVAYQGDIKQDDVLFWVTDMGWIMAPWELIGGLSIGCAVLIFDGAPDYPYPDRLWELVEENRVTFLGVSPSLIRALMKFGLEPVKKHDTSSLRSFGSTGEPWNPESFNWLFENVGKSKAPIVNLSGGTEVAACFLSVHPIVPTKICSLGGPCLGIDADVFDQQGKPLRGETGELVIKKPWPSMTRGLWKNPQRYLDSYWSRFPGVWVHGDWASIDADGYWYLHGRSDDTLKLAGKRVGPAEIESILASHPSVLESVAIGVPDEIRGETAVCFVVLKPGFSPNEELKNELRNHVATMFGESLKPSAILFITSIPKTRNAKLVRRLVKAKYLNLPLGDVSNLENPEALNGIASAR